MLHWYLSSGLFTEAGGGDTDGLISGLVSVWNMELWILESWRWKECAPFTSPLKDHTRMCLLRSFQDEQPLAVFLCCTRVIVKFSHRKVLQGVQQVLQVLRGVLLGIPWGNQGDSAARLSHQTVLCHNKMYTPANGLAQRRVKFFPEVREGSSPHPDDIVWASKEPLRLLKISW